MNRHIEQRIIVLLFWCRRIPAGNSDAALDVENLRHELSRDTHEDHQCNHMSNELHAHHATAL